MRFFIKNECAGAGLGECVVAVCGVSIHVCVLMCVGLLGIVCLYCMCEC